MSSKIVHFPGEWVGIMRPLEPNPFCNLWGRCSNKIDDALLKLISVLVESVALPIITKEKNAETP